MKTVLGVTKKNFIIYFFALIVSLVSIALGFILYEGFNIWATVFLSIGTSGVGAVLLAFFIERSNNLTKIEQAEFIIKTTYRPLFNSLTWLLMSVNNIICEYHKKFINNEFRFEKVSIQELFSIFQKKIEEIENYLAPVAASNGIATSEEFEESKKQQKFVEHLKSQNCSFKYSFADFERVEQQICPQETFLLSLDSSYEKVFHDANTIIKHIKYALTKETLSPRIFEIGHALEMLKDQMRLDSLNAIGFNDIKFNNKKGFLDYNRIKS
ncbi:MAG: hypothetical protein IKA99_05060 [Clostridia bacterium]|nr:hypothetical protein [Clostridia bacterium]